MTTTQTHIAGKDQALEVTIANFQQRLQQLGFTIEEASWLNPVPHVWSVHIRDKDCPLCFTNGKGASKKAALASALGEYFERLSTNYFFADFYLGPTIAHSEFVHYPNEKWFSAPLTAALPAALLDDYLRDYYDPEQQLKVADLIDLQSSNAERGICALPFIRQHDQQTVYIPVNIIGNLYVSNGMSAGNSEHEARVQALSEVFERYIKNKIIAEAISLPLIPNTVLQRYPHLQQAIGQLEQQGFAIFCYDASLGGQYPVICVVLFNPENSGCFASFGAHPNFSVALERTITELLQGRSLTDLDVFPSPSVDNDEVAEHTNLETHFIDSSGLISWDLFKQAADYPFVDWDFSGSTEQEFTTLMAIFAQQHQPVYIADYYHLGVYACRILVPGMSDIYPADDLLFANNNMAIHWRDTLLSLPASSLSPAEYGQLLSQLDEEGFDDFARVRELLGLATGSNNAWYSLRVGELKAMLALAAGDQQQALLWCEWTLEFNASTFSPQRSCYYRCLQTLLHMQLADKNLADYAIALSRMYSEPLFTAAKAALTGQQPFYDLPAIDNQLSQFTAQQTLLAAYQKLQLAKQRYAEKAGQDADK